MAIEQISDNELMRSFDNLIPYIPYWFDSEVVFTISNREKFLKVVNSKNYNLNTNAGDVIPEGCCADVCLKEQKIVSVIVPPSVFGNEFKTIGIPIKDANGEIAGTIVIGRPSMKQDITIMSEHVASAISQISVSINEVLVGVTDISNANQEISTIVADLNDQAQNTDEILDFVNDVAQQTNLLGLNAQIEAARAGDLGRGFGVVAQEIRKLSESSKESIKKINFALKNTQKLSANIKQKIEDTSGVFNQQASSIQEISATIEELNAIAQKLEAIAGKL